MKETIYIGKPIQPNDVPKTIRTLMYTMSVKRLPGTSEVDKAKNLYKKASVLVHAKMGDRMAVAIHDKPGYHHIHLAMHFKSSRNFQAIMGVIGDSHVQNYVKWSGGRNSLNNLWAYCNHKTTGAEKKTQHNKVIANFDFDKKIKEIHQYVVSNPNPVKKAIIQYANEIISFEQLVEQVGFAAIDENYSEIRRIQRLHDKNAHNVYKRDFKGKPIKSFVLCGTYPEAKKQEIAKKILAKTLSQPTSIATLTAAGGFFCNYYGERGAIVMVPEANFEKAQGKFWQEYLRNKLVHDVQVRAGNRYQYLNLEAVIFIVPPTIMRRIGDTRTQQQYASIVKMHNSDLGKEVFVKDKNLATKYDIESNNRHIFKNYQGLDKRYHGQKLGFQNELYLCYGYLPPKSLTHQIFISNLKQYEALLKILNNPNVKIKQIEQVFDKLNSNYSD